MTQVLFYHLTETGLDDALPVLVEECVERSWRVAIQTSDDQQRDALDAHLWSYRRDAFLPHGKDGDDPTDQSVFLTDGHANPNSATVRFLVDGAALPGDTGSYDRLMVMFDGNETEAVQTARAQWKSLKSDGHDLAYYKQTADGRWEKAA